MAEKVHVPPIKIQGIKTKIVPLIRENVMLSCDTGWVEPFMGSGVVGFNVAGRRAVFADINPHIIGFYNQLKETRLQRILQGSFRKRGAHSVREEMRM